MKRRCLVIGIDGLPDQLLRQLAGQGIMPFCARLLRQGSLLSLRAPVPEVSSTSWTTFLTGVNPARHGIYGFIDIKPGSYQFYFPNRTHISAPTIWDFAAGAGLRTLCLNVPTTYPARPIHGVLISGFPASDYSKSFFPQELAEECADLGYMLDVNVSDVETAPESFLRRVQQSIDARMRVFTRLTAREPWDLCVAVLTETDRLQHFLWSALDPAHVLHESVLGVYRQVDRCVETLVEKIGDGDDLFIVSDHGFTGVKAQLYLNAWLRHKGYLALAHDAESFDNIDCRTRAFALDPARIYLHRTGRFPRGSVCGGEVAGLRVVLRDELSRLRWDTETLALSENVGCEPIFENVFFKEEVYSGALLEGAPDLIVVPRPGFNLRGSWRHAEVLGSDAFTGSHTRTNAVFYYRGKLLGEAADMQDVAPTVLATLGVPFRAEFDGQNLLASMP